MVQIALVIAGALLVFLYADIRVTLGIACLVTALLL